MTYDEHATAREALPGQLRAALTSSTPAVRAELLERLARTVYDWSKFSEPGGEGLDGLDGPERQSLATVMDEVIEHAYRMRRHAMGRPGSDHGEY